MATAMFTISAPRGGYLRESMRSADTRTEARATMREALRYLGATDPVLVTWEDGSIAGYRDPEEAEDDRDGSRPTVYACLAGTEEE